MAQRTPTVVIADDNRADRLLTVTAFRKADMNGPIHEVADGEELMDYLLRQGRYADAPPHAGPLVILLDINMPRKSGLEALAEIKSHPLLRRIPVIMLTTSDADSDIAQAYDLGANSFVTKPLELLSFLTLIKQLGAWWLQLVTLPDPVPAGS